MKANKFTINGEVKLDLTQDTAVEEDVLAGKTFHKADGSPAVGTAILGGGGAELNIAYGDTAPEDTSKLWVKTTEPSGVKVDSEVNMVESDNASCTITDFKINGTYTDMVQVGNYVYSITPNDKNTIFKLDLITKEVTQLGVSLPGGYRRYAGVCAIGTKVYIVGGNSNGFKDTILCFDTETETITTLDVKLPVVLYKTTCCSYGNKIYTFGGESPSYNTMIDSVFCVDLDTNTATTLNALPFVMSESTALQIDKTIYLFGGKKDANNGRNIILKFNVDTQTFTYTNCVLPEDKYSYGLGAINTKYGVIICGFYYSASNKQNIFLFDPNKETIKKLDVTMPKVKCITIYIAKVTDDQFYMLGGYNGSAWTDEAFILNLGFVPSLEKNTLQIQSTLDKNIFNLLNTDTIKAEIGVKAVFKGNADNIGEQVEAALHNGTNWITI